MFWKTVRQLRGETLVTTRQKKRFCIVDVQDDRIIYVAERGNGGNRWTMRQDLEDINEALGSINDISPVDVRKHSPDDFNTSYIAAILMRVRCPAQTFG
jgi:hypothetical protein